MKIGFTNSYNHELINIFVFTPKGLFMTDNLNNFRYEYHTLRILDERSRKDKLIDKIIDKLICFKG